MDLQVWSDGAGTVFVQWGGRGPVRWIGVDGATGERLTLPADASDYDCGYDEDAA